MAPELIEDFLAKTQSSGGPGAAGWPPGGGGDGWPDGGEGGGEWDERGRWFSGDGEPGAPGETRS